MKHQQNRFCKAWDNINGCPIDIKDLPLTRNGQNCNCSCVDCKELLEACQGDVNAWFFRHMSKTNCKGGPMTALHLMAQFLLRGDHTINTAGRSVKYKSGVTEYKVPNSSFKCDVAGIKEGGQFFLIEIRVTHEIDKPKRTHFREIEVHSIEIDLRSVSPEITKDKLLELLLNDLSLQRSIYDPTMDSKPIISTNESNSHSWIDDLIPVGLIAGFVFALFSGIFSAPKKKKKK